MDPFEMVITGVAHRESLVDWETLSDGSDPRKGGMQVGARHVEQEVVEAATTAWKMAGLTPEHGSAASGVFGTFYGTHHTTEYLAATLADHGPKWLNPEAFLLHAPHASVGVTANKLSVRGSLVTVVGPDAGREALLHAARTLALGRSEIVLCGAFDWPSPFAAWAGERAGASLATGMGHAVVFVLERGSHAADRGGRPLARAVWTPKRGLRESKASPAIDVVAPLRECAKSLMSGAIDSRLLAEGLAVHPLRTLDVGP